MSSRYFEGKTPRILGHRGSFGLFPENTLLSFSDAAKHVPYLEMDVWSTKDGVIVVHHDRSALRTCGIDQDILTLSLSEVQRLDAAMMFSLDGGKTFPYRGKGQQIPALAQVLNQFPNHFFNIEVKQSDPEIETLVLDVIASAQASDRVLLTAEIDSVIKKIRKLGPSIATGTSTQEGLEFIQWLKQGCPATFKTECKALQFPVQHGPHLLADKQLIQAAHKIGLEVHFWTINSVAEAQKLFALGADGIVTDFPKLMADAFKDGFVSDIPKSVR